MNEILSIFFLSILLPVIATLQISNIVLNKRYLQIDKTSKLVINYLILLNIILLLSFFDLKLNFIIAFLSVIYFFIFLFKKNLLKDNFFFLITLSGLLFIISIHISNQLLLYWDVQKIWLPKTILFFNQESIINLKELSRENYPYFGSLYWSTIWKISMLNFEYIGRIGYVFLFLLSLLDFANTFKTNDRNKVIIFFLLVYIIYDYWHFRGTQEILIFSLILICSKAIYQLNNIKKNVKNESFGYLVVFFLTTNLLIWTKNEAIFFSLFLLLTLLMLIKKKLIFKFFLIFIFIILFFIKFIIFKIYNFNVVLSEDFNFFFLYKDIIKNLSFENIALIIKHFFISMFKFPSILLSLFFLVAILRRKNYFLIFPILNIFFLIFIYLSTSKDFNHMIVTGFNRVFFESSSYYLIFILIYFNNFRDKKFINFYSYLKKNLIFLKIYRNKKIQNYNSK
jgi:hypothetical protein